MIAPTTAPTSTPIASQWASGVRATPDERMGESSNPPIAIPNISAAPNAMTPASTAPSTRIWLNRLADIGRKSLNSCPTEQPPQASVILPDPDVRPDQSQTRRTWVSNLVCLTGSDPLLPGRRRSCRRADSALGWPRPTISPLGVELGGGEPNYRAHPPVKAGSSSQGVI